MAKAPLTEEKREKKRAYERAHYAANKASYRVRNERYKAENPEKVLATRKANGKKYNATALNRKNKWVVEKRKSDPCFKLVRNMRERARAALRLGHAIKNQGTLDLIGCGIDFLKGFIEAKFEIGMTWDNYGEWHIDHIIPCVAFDLSNHEAQKECFHYSNLQPLWAEINLAKSDRLPSGCRGRNNKILTH
jgi:hypothetical protein